MSSVWGLSDWLPSRALLSCHFLCLGLNLPAGSASGARQELRGRKARDTKLLIALGTLPAWPLRLDMPLIKGQSSCPMAPSSASCFRPLKLLPHPHPGLGVVSVSQFPLPLGFLYTRTSPLEVSPFTHLLSFLLGP